MKAIPTNYNNCRFRSRLEARWAVYFDALSIKWQYEPEGFVLDDGTLYLPDFWMPDLQTFAEVKPKPFTQPEFAKCELLLQPCLILDTGNPEIYTGYYITGFDWSCYEHYTHGDIWGRILLSPSSKKNRLWFALGESILDYWMDLSPEIKAKSSRFEHGEHP